MTNIMNVLSICWVLEGQNKLLSGILCFWEHYIYRERGVSIHACYMHGLPGGGGGAIYGGGVLYKIFCSTNVLKSPKTKQKTKMFLDKIIKKLFKRGSLSTLHACVYVYIWQLSPFRAPTLLFINLTVTTCHIQYTFLTLCKCFSWENRQNTEILEVCHYCMIKKWALPVIRCAILGEPL